MVQLQLSYYILLFSRIIVVLILKCAITLILCFLSSKIIFCSFICIPFNIHAVVASHVGVHCVAVGLLRDTEICRQTVFIYVQKSSNKFRVMEFHHLSHLYNTSIWYTVKTRQLYQESYACMQ